MSAADPPPDDDLLAAELAFGLADGEERRTAEARLVAEPAFAAAHARWVVYATAMLADGEGAPSQEVWRAIQARLPANDLQPEERSNGQLRTWRFATFAATAAAVVLGVVALERPAAPPPSPQVVRVPVPQPTQAPLVAVLTGTDRKAVMAISFDPGTGRITAAPTGLEPGRRATELWVIPGGGKPLSMGVISADRPTWRAVPTNRVGNLVSGAVLALSLEPAGGSPTGQPTGPVILTGKLALPS